MAGRRRKHGRRCGDRERREWVRLAVEITLTVWRTALAIWSSVHG
ncbi:hypothetical protein [Sphaerisporangium flaviroseum]